MRRHKYGARKTVVDGIEFASGREAKYYAELKLRERAGEVEAIQLQPPFELQPAFVDAQGRKHRAINYVADFLFFDKREGRMKVVDVKGMRTDVYKLKRKLLLHKYPAIHFEEA